MEDEVVIGIEDTECYMRLNAVTYNINRLYNLLHDKKLKEEETSNYNNNLMEFKQTQLKWHLLNYIQKEEFWPTLINLDLCVLLFFNTGQVLSLLL